VPHSSRRALQGICAALLTSCPTELPIPQNPCHAFLLSPRDEVRGSKDGEQMAELFGYCGAYFEGLGDFAFDELSETFAEAMH
jgi:hypothetical protein